MEDANRFFFTKEELDNSPSRKSGIDAARELSYRQQAANFIQDMGQRLQLSQLCINTAIVYMHRFYVFHSFAEVHRNHLSVCVLFLAAKVEEQPRKLEHLIKVAHACLHKDAPPLDVRSDAYLEKLQEVVAHENILLQALGFVLAIEHPHTYVVKVCQLVKASKDLAQTSYIMATTSLHMTTMCLQYKPTVVACVCIHLACKWSSYMIEPCSEGRDWFYYVDRTVTWDLLEELTQDFIAILETSPHRFKRKLGCKDSVIYHNPKCIMDSSEKPSTSEKRNGLSRKDSSPGPSTSLSFDFCPDFDEKRVQKFDSPEKSSSSFHPPTSTQIPSSHHSPGASKEKDHVERKLPQIVENNISKKAPEVHIKQEVHVKHEPHFKPEVHKQEPHFKPEVTVKQETHVKPTEVHIKPEVHSKHDNAKRHVKRESPEKAPVSKSTVLQIPAVVLTPLPPSQPIVVVLPKESKAVDKTHSTIVENNVSSKKSLDGHSKHERREKHKSKHSCHSSSKEKHSSKHSEQVTGLKVKILREKISLKGNHESQKTTAPIKAESPQKKIRITIKQPPLPETPKLVKPMEAPLKLVLTKDKSGSGSYVTSHKNERESRKRSHSTVVSPDVNYKNSYETHPLKYPKNEHTQKSHGSDVHGMSSRPNKIPRHSSHRTTVDNSQYQHTPPLPHPKHRGHNMPVGKTNSNTVQPPLPPPQPPPPPPPPE